MRNYFIKLIRIGHEILKGIFEHRVLTMAAALAFYFTLSLAPLLLVTLSVVGFFGFDIRPEIQNEIYQLIGPKAAKITAAIMKNTQAHLEINSEAGVLGLVTLIFSSSGAFAQLQNSLNLIWHESYRGKKGVWEWGKHRLFSITVLFTLAFLVLVLFAASVMIPWKMLNSIFSFSVYCLVFASLFKILPDTKLKWSNTLRGGFMTAIFFIIGKYFIGLYLGENLLASAYGAAGSLIVLLLWIYYSSIIFFIGAEYTRVLSLPKDIGPLQKH